MANATTVLSTLNADFNILERQYIVKNAATVYTGRYAALDASGGISTGYLTVPADTAGVVMLGFILGGGLGSQNAAGAMPDTVLGDTSASRPPMVRVAIGGGVLRGVFVAGLTTQAGVGRKVYLSTNNISDLTATPTTNIPAIGVVERFNSSTSFDVRLFSAAQMAGEV